MENPSIKNLSKNKFKINFILILLVILLAVAPLFIVKDGEFGGADDKAEQAITEINSSYKPWFSPILEPASGEIESLLFALQAAIGAGVLGYGIGYLKGSRSSKLERDHDLH